ncbi:MAG: lamin tail domain-containing protein [Flavobacterium sp.]|nr:lamin tail domain-containing protein [Flavobacterium sp.]
MVITDGQPCTVAATFTVNKKTGSCGNLSDLIMSEIYDNPSGSLGYIEVFNGTGATIDLSTYYIRRYGDNADFIANNFTDFTFSPGVTSIANGAVIYGRISTDANITTPSFDYGNSSGINGNDILHLYNGSTLIDVYIVPNNTSGYTALRNTTTSGPNAISNPSDWTHTNTASIANLGSFSFVPSGATPSIVTNPVSVSSCSNSVTFSVAATPFGIGVLTYQWYYNNGTTSGWTLVNTTSFPSVSTSGFTTNTLNLSGGISNINGYQFYCLVIQDGICSVYSNAAQLKIDSTTWNGTSWSSGLPSLTTLAIINGNYNTSLNGSFECCSLIVNTGFILNIQANNFVLIENNLTVNGTLNVLDDGSLIQVNNDGVNTGNIIYERATTGNSLDYVYWSSPVGTHVLGTSNYYYRWNPIIANTNGGIGNWINASGATMNIGQGYILRDVFAINFNGVPNNGILNVPVSRGNYTGAAYLGTNGVTITNLNDNLNLIGNPYPSAVNTLTFLTANTNIEGAVRIWTHGTSPSSTISNPFYGSYQQNYSSNDYIIYNGTGTTSGPTGFSGNIAGGQGFFVIMNDGTATTQNVVFNNSMRDKTYGNNEFYRSSTLNNEDKSRIWLNFNSSNESSKTLIGYIVGATMDKDRLYDAVLLESSSSSIYSLIDSKKMVIQGRFPFNDSDKVPFGVKITQVGNNSIGIDAVDGIFENQNIYLEDLYLNIVHNIKQSPYSFTSQIGVFNDRFEVVYRNGTLSNLSFTNENTVFVHTNENTISVKSSEETIKSITVFDVLGRNLINQASVNEKTYSINSIQPNNQALFVKIILNNGQSVNKKIIF